MKNASMRSEVLLEVNLHVKCNGNFTKKMTTPSMDSSAHKRCTFRKNRDFQASNTAEQVQAVVKLVNAIRLTSQMLH